MQVVTIRVRDMLKPQRQAAAAVLEERFTLDTVRLSHALLQLREMDMDSYMGPYKGGSPTSRLAGGTTRLSKASVRNMEWDCTCARAADGGLVGVAISCYVAPGRRGPAQGHRLLVLLAVRKEHERKGYGSLLFRGVETKARMAPAGTAVLVLASSGGFSVFWDRPCLGLTKLVGGAADVYNIGFCPFPDPDEKIQLLRKDAGPKAAEAAAAVEEAVAVVEVEEEEEEEEEEQEQEQEQEKEQERDPLKVLIRSL